MPEARHGLPGAIREPQKYKRLAFRNDVAPYSVHVNCVDRGYRFQHGAACNFGIRQMLNAAAVNVNNPASQFDLAEQPNGFHPAERFRDPETFGLADLIALVAVVRPSMAPLRRRYSSITSLMRMPMRWPPLRERQCSTMP